MEIWTIWVLVALALFVVEVFTSGFAIICLSFGALGGAVVAAFDCSLAVQLLVFCATSIAALLLVRPVLKRLFFRGGDKAVTNADGIIGRRGVVCVDIPAGGDGRVMVDGVDWKAVSVDDNAIASGEKVEVVAFESVVLTVKKL